MKRTLGALAIAAVAVIVCTATAQTRSQSRTPVSSYRVVNTFPHDHQSYTQGLIFRDGVLFESAGRYGQSSLRKVKLETGEVLQQVRVDSQYFAEGLAEWSGKLIQLTWQHQIGFVYDLATFKLQRTFRYTGEGWGLTHDGRRLILSDGSDTLRFLDPVTFEVLGRITVRDGTVPVEKLNELEYIRGEIYANIYQTDRIARISPQSGRVLGWIDLTGILSSVYQRDPNEAVLNGIAYDPKQDRLFVTGKLWPKLFEIRALAVPTGSAASPRGSQGRGRQ